MNRWKRTNLINPDPLQRLIFHVLFWLLLFGLRFYLTLISFNVYSGLSPAYVALLNVATTGALAATYYILISLVRGLITSRRLLSAACTIAGIILLYTLADTALEQVILQPCNACMVSLKVSQPAYYGLLTSGFINIVLKRLLSLGTPLIWVLTISIPLCIKLARDSWRVQLKNLQLAKSNIELEFNFLKSQINPHFLFNTMNNIYGLILKEDTARSAALVARLSDLFRYMLYETNKSYMPLSKEVKLLNDYIELEKVRLNETVVRSEIVTGDADYEVPPLLLIPLVENAFKFTADKSAATIYLFLSMVDGSLNFTLNNTVDDNRLTPNEGGIGISNFRKRLELYYKGRYSYEATLQKQVYCVNLTIEL